MLVLVITMDHGVDVADAVAVAVAAVSVTTRNQRCFFCFCMVTAVAVLSLVFSCGDGCVGVGSASDLRPQPARLISGH